MCGRNVYQLFTICHICQYLTRIPTGFYMYLYLIAIGNEGQV
jgi:hypothetical protein